jgi:HEPN domain-containing protein
MNDWIAHAASLDKFYIPARYPNGLPDLTPGQVYISQDAEQAIEKAIFFWKERVN